MSTATIHPHPSRTLRLVPAPTRLKLTRRGRLVVFSVALVLVLGAFVLLGSQVIATDRTGTPVQTISVTVQPGQTLWDIAAEANPGGDIRSTVKQISDLNSLTTAGSLQIGEDLAVPRY